MLKMKRALVPSAIVVFGALALACGGGGDDEKPGTTGTTGGGDAGTPGGACDSTKKPYVTKTVDATDTAMNLTGVTVEVVDDETGLPVAGSTAVSGSDSKVTLMVDPCKKFGIKAHGMETHTDTYSYHVKPENSGKPDQLVRMGSNNTSLLVPMAAIYDVKDDKAPGAGAVYWKTPSMEFYDVVGCAHVEELGGGSLEGQDLRYFADRLPSSLTSWPLSKGTRIGDGKFFIGNMTPGKHTIVAKVDGTEIGRTDLMVFPRSQGSTMVGGHPANLFLAGVYIDAEAGAKNPTPANCADTQK